MPRKQTLKQRKDAEDELFIFLEAQADTSFQAKLKAYFDRKEEK